MTRGHLFSEFARDRPTGIVALAEAYGLLVRPTILVLVLPLVMSPASCARSSPSRAMEACKALEREGIASACTPVPREAEPKVAEVSFKLGVCPGGGTLYATDDEATYTRVLETAEVKKWRQTTGSPRARIVVWFDAETKACFPRVSSAVAAL